MQSRFIVGAGHEARPSVIVAPSLNAALELAILRNSGPSDITSTTAPQAWAEPYTARRAVRVGVTRI